MILSKFQQKYPKKFYSIIDEEVKNFMLNGNIDEATLQELELKIN